MPARSCRRSRRCKDRHGPDSHSVLVTENVKLSPQDLDLAAAAQTRRVEECTLAACDAGLHRKSEAMPMGFPQIGRHDKIKLLADGIHRRMAEQRRGAGAPEPDHAACIGNYDCVLV